MGIARDATLEERRAYNREWYARNKEWAGPKRREYAYKRRKANPKWWAKEQRKHHLARFGLTPMQFADMLAAQGARCAICRAPEAGGGRDWHVDHDHATKTVRGLLCLRCNLA